MALRCPDCGVQIVCRTERCPLCGKALHPTKEQLRGLPRAFPPRGRPPIFSNASFDTIYGLSALLVLALSYTVEGVMTHRVPFSMAITGGVLYLYWFVRSTLQSNTYFSQKVLIQALMWTVWIFFCWPLFPRPLVIFEWVLPVLYFVALALVGVYILCRIHQSRKFLLNLLAVSLLGLIPFLVSVIAGGMYFAALANALVGLTVFCVTLGMAPRTVMAELKRLFHF